MARELIPIAQIPRNGGTVVPSVGTINTSDGNYLAAGYSDEVIVYVNNTGDPGTVSLVPGVNPPGLTSAQGTVEIAVAGTAEAYLRLETARVVQSDGSINIDFSSGMAGDVAAYDPIVRGLR